MGAGIALTALRAERQVVLTDVAPAALDRAQQYILKHLERKGQQQLADRLTLADEIESLANCEVVIEAALEQLELKRRLFGQLDRICRPAAILASNTSNLSITALAAATERPERVAGMHFFNPAPVMQLVEVVRGAATADDTVAALVQLSEALGKIPVVVEDRPGFIVNRVARPFYGEALRLVGENVSDHQQIDIILKLGGGFKMGPFELMDLIGIDVNLAAAESIYQASFLEPRFRPHWIQQQKVSQGELGRKTGRGFYAYPDGKPLENKLEPPASERASGKLLLAEGSWAPGLAEQLKDAGYQLLRAGGGTETIAGGAEGVAVALVASGGDEWMDIDLQQIERSLAADVPILCQTVDRAYSELAGSLARPDRLVGFDGLFAASGRVITLTGAAAVTQAVRQQVDQLARSLGKLPIWIGESPAMVVPRVVCSLANEAAFSAMERIAEPEQIDRAVVLGLNYPHGPLAWAEQLGFSKVVAVLDHLRREFGEERYRAAPLLRRWARTHSHA